MTRAAMSTECLFCKIAAGEMGAQVVAESPEAVAFLDHRPVFPGHCLVVPRAHAETLTDLPAPAVAPLFTFVQRVTRAVEVGCGADGSFVAMNNRVSQSVPHLHVHVVPRRKKDGLRGFFWPRQKYETAEAAERMRDAIHRAFS
jgi:histidine triad (HIT) family protein